MTCYKGTSQIVKQLSREERKRRQFSLFCFPAESAPHATSKSASSIEGSCNLSFTASTGISGHEIHTSLSTFPLSKFYEVINDILQISNPADLH